MFKTIRNRWTNRVRKFDFIVVHRLDGKAIAIRHTLKHCSLQAATQRVYDKWPRNTGVFLCR